MWITNIYYKTISNGFANATSINNVAFHLLTREYMQLASAWFYAAGGKGNIVPLHCLYEGKMLTVQ